MNNIRVAVCLVTYNQEKYIKQAIDSVLKQKTTFPVDIIVGNDASTDGTMDVIQSVVNQCVSPIGGGGEIIVFNREKNMGIVGNTINIFRYIFAYDYTYVAMLDGDDWWCDENKLQMQVDLMEKNKDVSFCYTRGGCYNEQKKELSHSSPINHPQGDIFKTMIHEYRILNGTVMHRGKLLKNIDWDELIAQRLLYLDYPTNVMMAAQGPVGYIDKETYIWRRGIASVSAPKDINKAYEHCESQYRQGVYLSQKFPKTPYDMPMQSFEQYLLFRKYEEALVHKNPSEVLRWYRAEDFPKDWIIGRPECRFLSTRLSIICYLFVLKKFVTLYRMIFR